LCSWKWSFCFSAPNSSQMPWNWWIIQGHPGNVYRSLADLRGVDFLRRPLITVPNKINHVSVNLHYCCMYVCMYKGGPKTGLAPRPLMIYCASIFINPWLIPHFEWSVGLCLWGRHSNHLVP
jgi:hypothetical protein